MRERINSMQSPGGNAHPGTPMSIGSPTNRARMTQQQQLHAQQEAQKKQQMLWGRQQQALQRQPSMMSQQQMDFAGAAGSQGGNPGTIISPVSTGLENMTMNSGGVDEIGRIQNLLTDNGDFENIESEGLQMDDEGVDAFGNVNLLNIRNEDMQTTSLHDSQLKLFANMTGHGQKVSTCAFSSDGQWLASAGVDKKVLIWSVATKELKCTIDGPEGHTGQVTNARFCSDDRLILGTTSQDNTVRIWDLTPLAQGASMTARSISVLKGHKMTVTAVDFCPMIGSNRCVSCDFDGELRIWNFITGDCERVINKMSEKQVYSSKPVRYHPQNPNIIAVALGKSLYVVNINDPNSQPRAIDTTHKKNILTLDWSMQGHHLATASEDQVCVWDTTQTAQWRVLASQQLQKISSCAFVKTYEGAAGGANAVTSTQPTRLVYGEYEKIWTWAFGSGRFMGTGPVTEPQAHPGAAVTALACTSSHLDGENVLVLASASAGKDGNLKLWKIAG
ncbi:WD40 repeat-like protein [Linnemannia elongata AG-77]|uniref:WD40 repeat-like protein n=1 Tax=Linnemannia elongata AG-77 TaxID=1314771 RepID=A0A197KDP1_9FUNG|nr:WD40 repeat-like protein [Linnemannia elongata AG-77]